MSAPSPQDVLPPVEPEQQSEKSISTPNISSGDQDMVDLPLGSELSEAAAIALAAARPVHWVVVAGQADSGKTTLLASLYELFQWGRVGRVSFAGSGTLPGFEQRCHLSREASGRDDADTQRTKYRDFVPTYLHLQVAPGDEINRSVDFLFTDVSGEVYEHARDSTDDCREMKFIRRAQSFWIVLDGERMVQLDKQWAVVEEAISLLRSCLDSGMISDGCVVSIVWAKVDFFSGDQARAEQFVAQAEARFQTRFASRLAHLRFVRIAARPKRAQGLGFGKGLPELLQDLLARSVQRDLLLFPESQAGERESEMYAVRRLSVSNENQ